MELFTKLAFVGTEISDAATRFQHHFENETVNFFFRVVSVFTSTFKLLTHNF